METYKQKEFETACRVACRVCGVETEQPVEYARAACRDVAHTEVRMLVVALLKSRAKWPLKPLGGAIWRNYSTVPYYWKTHLGLLATDGRWRLLYAEAERMYDGELTGRTVAVIAREMAEQVRWLSHIGGKVGRLPELVKELQEACGV